jgi:rRNA maturation protein Nop10
MANEVLTHCGVAMYITASGRTQICQVCGHAEPTRTPTTSTPDPFAKRRHDALASATRTPATHTGPLTFAPIDTNLPGGYRAAGKGSRGLVGGYADHARRGPGGFLLFINAIRPLRSLAVTTPCAAVTPPPPSIPQPARQGTNFSNGANPRDAEAVNGIDPWRDLYRYTCPTCGGPAMIAEFAVTSPADPVPRLIRRLTCRRSSRRKLPRDEVRCPTVDL